MEIKAEDGAWRSLIPSRLFGLLLKDTSRDSRAPPSAAHLAFLLHSAARLRPANVGEEKNAALDDSLSLSRLPISLAVIDSSS
ncbi:hypothetical protein Q7C36_000898 [Tachysurus vachellii]|uniref:Uncharacterized protein n=1 Tax=Tachysurus vachellii TaxID=175792 RepID=A0AA88T8L6_TACVA|nr:hypothetical protein Q7C36_000898 [Tachysurus vachellii]